MFKSRGSNNSQRRQKIALKNETKAKRNLRLASKLQNLKVVEASENYLCATENENISQLDGT